MEKRILALDRSNMLAKVGSLPSQLESGLVIARRVWESMSDITPNSITVAGMGGSAIGAEVLRSYTAPTMRVPVAVCRDYTLPAFVDKDSLVVVSSYSGNTEEALSCFDDAMERQAAVVCVTSGGALMDRAERCSITFARLPTGYPPRAAVGYSFAALLALVWHLGLCDAQPQDLSECIDHLNELGEQYSNLESPENDAVSIARELVDRIPIVYCSNRIAAVGLRWKNQFCENSKVMSFTGLLPEMSHNDVMGWERDLKGISAAVLLLRRHQEHPRVDATFGFIGDLVRGRAGSWREVWGSGSSLLSQMFSLILLGDYVSVYLALLRGLDPTPIVTIESLKTRLRARQE